jgi:hypothetical protein
MVTGPLRGPVADGDEQLEWAMSAKTISLGVLLAGLVSALPAAAEDMRPDEARRFVAGKHFAYTCFEGTSGHGRIYADGSVAGYIQIGGTGPRRYVVLPPGTLRVRGDQYCASVRGIPFEPCFNLQKTSTVSFRGAVSGLGFAYCDFSRRSARADLSRSPLRLRRLQSAAAAGE